MRRNEDLYPRRSDQQHGLSPWSGSSLLDPPTFFSASPWQAMRRMQDEMDHLFGQFFPPMTTELQRTAQQWAPSVDISQDDREWLIEAELPGGNRDQIHVELRGDQLMIRGEMRQEQEGQPQGMEGQHAGNGQQKAAGSEQGQPSQRQYHQRERRYGYFERVLTLPENVDGDKVQCEFRDGVLKIHLPKTPEQQQQARRIPISDGQAQQLGSSGMTTESQRTVQPAGAAQGKATNGAKAKEPAGTR